MTATSILSFWPYIFIYHILKSENKRTFLAGNIGISPLEFLEKTKKGDKIILELSSFELENLKQSPNIAVVTNILPDHLNRYVNMAEYIESKKIILKYINSYKIGKKADNKMANR